MYLLMHNEDYVAGHVDTGFLAKNSEAILKWDKESRKASKK